MTIITTKQIIYYGGTLVGLASILIAWLIKGVITINSNIYETILLYWDINNNNYSLILIYIIYFLTWVENQWMNTNYQFNDNKSLVQYSSIFFIMSWILPFLLLCWSFSWYLCRTRERERERERKWYHWKKNIRNETSIRWYLRTQ